MSHHARSIDRALLRSLLDCGNHLVIEELLKAQTGVYLQSPLPLLDADFKARRDSLAEAGLIISTAAAYGAVKWKLTDEGRLYCSENKI